MKRQNKNRPSPFLGRRLYEATKPGFSFLCLFCVIFVFLAFRVSWYFWLFVPEMTCYVSRGMLSTCSLSRTGVQNTVGICKVGGFQPYTLLDMAVWLGHCTTEKLFYLRLDTDKEVMPLTYSISPFSLMQ